MALNKLQTAEFKDATERLDAISAKTDEAIKDFGFISHSTLGMQLTLMQAEMLQGTGFEVGTKALNALLEALPPLHSELEEVGFVVANALKRLSKLVPALEEDKGFQWAVILLEAVDEMIRPAAQAATSCQDYIAQALEYANYLRTTGQAEGSEDAGTYLMTAMGDVRKLLGDFDLYGSKSGQIAEAVALLRQVDQGASAHKLSP